MTDPFDLPVTWNNKLLHFPAQLINYSYGFIIEVEVDGFKILFERDEERNWRAKVRYEEIEVGEKINRQLLQAIAEAIEEILR